MRSDVKLFEAGQPAEGQSRNPPDLAAVQVERLQVGKISEVICSQNGLVKEDVGTLNTQSPGSKLNYVYYLNCLTTRFV